jgi:large subunit ribosomal protein L4
MLKVNLYSNKGIKSATTVTLPKEWEEKSNNALLSQAIRVYTDRAHFGLHKTKTRSEINKTTKKLYKQKGTGGARHGARSAPIFVGGAIAHGPRGKSRELTIPTTMKRKAMGIAMTQAVKKGNVIAGDISFKKTNETQNFITKVFKKDQKVTFVVGKTNSIVARNIRNIKNAKAVNFMDLNAYVVFFGGKIILDKSIFAKEVKKKKEITK